MLFLRCDLCLRWLVWIVVCGLIALIECGVWNLCLSLSCLLSIYLVVWLLRYCSCIGGCLVCIVEDFYACLFGFSLLFSWDLGF